MTQQGTFAGCKPPLRLTLFEDLVYNEIYTPTKWQRNNMYAAWWYCCIPISVIEKNGLPFPCSFVVTMPSMAFAVRLDLSP